MGTLSISSFTETTAAANVSTITLNGKATEDWVVPTAISTFQQKSGASLLSTRTNGGDFGSGTSNGGGTQGTVISWTSDGDPTASGSNTSAARVNCFNASESNYWEFTCGVGTGERTLRLWLGRYSQVPAAGDFTIFASLSDASAADVELDLAGVSSDRDGYCDITFAADSAGQTLTVRTINNTTAVNGLRVNNLRAYAVSEATAGGTSGDLSSAGTGAFSGEGLRKQNGDFSVASVTALSLVGGKLQQGTLSVSNIAVVSPLGKRFQLGDLSSAGLATASFTAITPDSTTGITGLGTVTPIGKKFQKGDMASAGVASAIFYPSNSASLIAEFGTSTASFVGAKLQKGDVSSAGLTTLNFSTSHTVTATFTGTNNATVSFGASWEQRGDLSSAGSATPSFVGVLAVPSYDLSGIATVQFAGSKLQRGLMDSQNQASVVWISATLVLNWTPDGVHTGTWGKESPASGSWTEESNDTGAWSEEDSLNA